MRVLLALLVCLPATFPRSRFGYPLDRLTYKEAGAREKVVMENIYYLVDLLKWKDFNETVELMQDDFEMSMVFHVDVKDVFVNRTEPEEIFELMTKKYGDVYMLRTHYGCKVDFNKVYNNLELMFESGLLLNMETWWESTEEIPTKANMTFLLHRIVLQPCYITYKIPQLNSNNETWFQSTPINLDFAWIGKRMMLRFMEFFNVNDWTGMWITELFHPNASLKWSYNNTEFHEYGVNETVLNIFFNSVKFATNNITFVGYPILYTPALAVSEFTAIQQVNFTFNDPWFNVLASFEWNDERDLNEPWQFTHIHFFERKVQKQ